MSRLAACFLTILIASAAAPALADDISVKAGDTEINISVRPASGNTILIWQANEVGLLDFDQTLMQQLSGKGIETWLLDVLENYFLANTPNNMDRVPAAAFANVIQAAVKTGKHVIVATSGRGAIPVLRGVRQWQQQHPADTHLRGTILISPKFYAETPDPGLPGKLMPIVRATNQAIVLLQPDKSPWYWKLDQSLRGLKQGGSDVYVWPLRGIRDRFYFRPDATNREQDAARLFASQITTALKILQDQPLHARTAVAGIRPAPKAAEGKKPHELAAFKGNPIPPPLQLSSLLNKQHNLQEYHGSVVLVNFWATWCPPCVHEMPSMQKLQDAFKHKPFIILGVNMAEDEATVRNFVRKRVQVSFPILLDKNGQALKAWHVFAFPTSYIVDKQGRIRYALFGGIDWNTPEVKQILSRLIAE